ncbi:glycosyltransferase [Rhodococcus artemisiae]|uniref:Glycosyltransferase n=1 Tax=Rhodococcus artemisiae TaxID=714159 RepID=A0ABU7LFR2_9NOCA|nr:glycosyltransferase [Rhodococcus artemisiae]MEE2060392.1 glycosyltransferase [Rhodococcus artemisiae]
MPYIAPRDFRRTIEAFQIVRNRLKTTGSDFDEAVSTGAALALAALPAARVAGISTRYIESVSRTDGPSLSGRVLHALRFSALEAQHAGWATGRWKHRPSVMSTYRAVERTQIASNPKIFVTLGTIKPYRFDSAVDAVLRTGLANDETVWQLGSTTREGLPGIIYETVENDHFESLVKDADVVITHSGVGSILKILGLGKYPVVLPRDKSRGEHVDDHQMQIANLVSQSAISTAVDPLKLTRDDVLDASSRRVVDEGVGN